MNALRNLIHVARKEGVGVALKSLRHRIKERYYERWFGSETSEEVRSEELGFASPELHFYAATDYGSLYSVLRRMISEPQKEVFIDYGSGKGRALLIAASMGFRKVIGVELSPELNTVARRNIEAATARKRLRTRDIEIVEMGADIYKVPTDVTIAYLCNPFHGSILTETFRRLRESVQAAPRVVTIICRLPLKSAIEQELPSYPFFASKRETNFSEELRYWTFRMDPETPSF